ncbi:MAG: PQQ-binding-like beta-propeller repeat protein [Bryobacteraceae bacterium]
MTAAVGSSLLVAIALAGAVAPAAERWTQFRGPNAAGISQSTGLPEQFNDSTRLWRTALPPGKSSPVFAGNRIFLTAHEGGPQDGKLLTVCLDRRDGRILWKRDVPQSRQERRHKLNDAAAPTPVTDGRNVYSFFADFGLVSYTAAGKERWRLPLPPMPSMQGVAGSPILYGDRLLLVVDQAEGSYMVAVNTANGEAVWRRDRRPAPGGAYSSPVLFHPEGGQPQLVTFSPNELAGFSIATGEKIWWVGGLPPQPKSTPVVAGDMIFAFARSFYGDGLPPIAPWDKALAENDRDANGSIEKAEAPEGPAKRYFGVVDRNKDGHVDAVEWAGMIEAAAPSSVLMAIRPPWDAAKGHGDLSATAVAWRFDRNIPDVPSPLFYEGILYMVQNGGILTALDAATGKVHKQGRLTGALGDYYASPVAAAGNIYFVNQEGKLTVVRAGQHWEIIAVSDLGEDCFATPAPVDNAVYVRTASAIARYQAAP